MANPPNLLDKFASYTYHFALFAHKSVDAIESISHFPEEFTQRYAGVDSEGATLLINSVKDAHQIIDDLSFTYINSFVNTGTPLVPAGELSLTVFEPGDCMFLHKLKNAMDKYQCTKPAFVCFGLKIKFVGLTPDNEVDEIEVPIIPMVLADMKASFDHRGGTYNMKFVMTCTFGSTANPSLGLSLNLGQVPDSIAFEAKTIGEALNLFKQKLQDNYDRTRATDSNIQGPRLLKYEIETDGPLAGFSLRNTAASNSSEGTKYHVIIDAGMNISDAILKIIGMSKEANDYIGPTGSSFKKQLHAGAKMWTIIPSYEPSDGSVTMRYKIREYVGDENETYEFDFYFADVPNVDVISYDVSFAQSTIAYLGADTDFSVASKVTHAVEDIGNSTVDRARITENKKVDSEDMDPTPHVVTGGTGDVAGPQASTVDASRGFIMFQPLDIPSKKKALDAMAKAMSADYAQKTLRIRGMPQLLESCVGDTSTIPFGVEGGIWVKVNVYTRELIDGVPGPKIPYFYQGWYHLISVQSYFSGGKFEQELTLVMVFENAGQEA